MDARTASVDELNEPARAHGLDGLSRVVAARALAASSDVAMIIDDHGIVRDITIGDDDLTGRGIEDWLNQPWADTVASESRGKISEMLAGIGTPGRWRQVNHSLASGDLPIRYLTIPAGDGSVVAIGRDMRAAAAFQQRLLRAQQSMERDSLRLRQLEARYRLLFDSAPEAIVVIDATTRRIIEANPAARRIAGPASGTIEGLAFTALVHADDREIAVAALGKAAVAEQGQPGRIRLADGQVCGMSASLFRQDRGTFLLIRLELLERAEAAPDRQLEDVLERMPDAFALTDSDLGILACNGAFLDLVHQPRSDDVRGQTLLQFVGRPGIDAGLLQSQLREHGMVRNFATVVRDAGGREEAVEVSAVTAGEGGALRHGFSIRPVGRQAVAATDDRQTPRSVEQLTELVGRVSLKEIVRESTDLIERLCIEAALTYTSDNRASAAEILGLSRQSLYSKLHRHGLGNLTDND